MAWELPITRANSLFAVEGGFHLPYFSFIKPVSPYLYLGMHDLQWVFLLLLGLGIYARISAGALLVLQGYIFFSDQLNFRNHPYFFLLVLLLLTFSPAGESFSVPALIRRLRRGAGPSDRTAPLTSQRLIQLQVSIVYGYASLHKMTAAYLNGRVLTIIMAPAIANGRLGTILSILPASLAEALQTAMDRPAVWAVAAWSTVLLELSLAFALWIPRVRKPAMIFGICFHLSIAILMNIDTFSLAMIGSYLLFLDPETLPRLFARMAPGPAGVPAPAPAAARLKRRPKPR